MVWMLMILTFEGLIANICGCVEEFYKSKDRDLWRRVISLRLSFDLCISILAIACKHCSDHLMLSNAYAGDLIRAYAVWPCSWSYALCDERSVGSGGAFGVGAKRLNGAQKAKAAVAALSVSMCMSVKHGPYVRAPYLFVVSWLNVSKLQIAVLFSV